jgi:hypothetical protein
MEQPSRHQRHNPVVFESVSSTSFQVAFRSGEHSQAYRRLGLLKPLWVVGGPTKPTPHRLYHQPLRTRLRGRFRSCIHQNDHRLLVEFPELTHNLRATTRHDMVHHINITPQPPVCSKPHLLAPNRLKLVKAEFEMMLEQALIRPSKSSWASPLHAVPKKDGGLRLPSFERTNHSRQVCATAHRGLCATSSR